MLMQHIEPELTTEGLKTVEEKYKSETPEEKEARKKRYALAFERYDQAYSEYVQTLQTQVTRYRKDSFEHVELEDRSQEENILESLTQGIFQQTV